MSKVILINSGQVRGFEDTHPISSKSTHEQSRGDRVPVQKYLGIPYGQAKRWTQAAPPLPWSSILDCVEFGANPPQLPGLLSPKFAETPGWKERGHLGISEDMFFLNVFMSDGVKEGDNVPVLVWIYGGSWKDGSTTSYMYDPTDFIRSAPFPIIVVTLNYRVNVFGFLACEDLRDDKGLVGNYGVRDQTLALRWVKSNIAKFGGDSTNVTVFGESAGGASVGYQIANSRETLFQRAILQSGAAATMPYQSISEHEVLWKKMLTHFDIASDDPERVQKVRNLSMRDILKFQAANPAIQSAFCAETGTNAIWNRAPDAIIADGGLMPSVKSVMLGLCEDEGTIFALLSGMSSNQKSVDRLLSVHSQEIQNQLTSLYPGIDSIEQVTGHIKDNPASKVFSDSIFDGPVMLLAELLVDIYPEIGTYLYLNSALLPQWEKFDWGIHHCSELPFVFNLSALFAGDADVEKTGAQISRYWQMFAQGGKPSPNWPAYTATQKRRMRFFIGGKDVVEDTTDWKKAEMQIWKRVLKSRYSISHSAPIAAKKEARPESGVLPLNKI